jgi:hypothetical protein
MMSSDLPPKSPPNPPPHPPQDPSSALLNNRLNRRLRPLHLLRQRRQRSFRWHRRRRRVFHGHLVMMRLMGRNIISLHPMSSFYSTYSFHSLRSPKSRLRPRRRMDILQPRVFRSLRRRRPGRCEHDGYICHFYAFSVGRPVRIPRKAWKWSWS